MTIKTLCLLICIYCSVSTSFANPMKVICSKFLNIPSRLPKKLWSEAHKNTGAPNEPRITAMQNAEVKVEYSYYQKKPSRQSTCNCTVHAFSNASERLLRNNYGLDSQLSLVLLEWEALEWNFFRTLNRGLLSIKTTSYSHLPKTHFGETIPTDLFIKDVFNQNLKYDWTPKIWPLKAEPLLIARPRSKVVKKLQKLQKNFLMQVKEAPLDAQFKVAALLALRLQLREIMYTHGYRRPVKGNTPLNSKIQKTEFKTKDFNQFISAAKKAFNSKESVLASIDFPPNLTIKTTRYTLKDALKPQIGKAYHFIEVVGYTLDHDQKIQTLILQNTWGKRAHKMGRLEMDFEAFKKLFKTGYILSIKRSEK